MISSSRMIFMGIPVAPAGVPPRWGDYSRARSSTRFLWRKPSRCSRKRGS